MAAASAASRMLWTQAGGGGPCLGLQLVVLGLVLGEHVQQELGGFPHHGALQKQVSHGVELDGRPGLLGHHLGQRHCSRGVVHHHALQQVHVVRRVALQKQSGLSASLFLLAPVRQSEVSRIPALLCAEGGQGMQCQPVCHWLWSGP